MRTSFSRNRLDEVRTLLIGFRETHSCRIAWLYKTEKALLIFFLGAGASGNGSLPGRKCGSLRHALE